MEATIETSGSMEVIEIESSFMAWILPEIQLLLLQKKIVSCSKTIEDIMGRILQHYKGLYTSES